jgi:hypothetical protein
MLPYQTDLESGQKWETKTSKRVGKVLSVLVVSGIIAFSSSTQASWKMQSYCKSKPITMEEWVSDKTSVDAIFVGKALEVKARQQQGERTGCWVRFTVNRWLRGQGSSDIWVRSAVATRYDSAEDQEILRLCNFSAGSTYAVFGHYVPDEADSGNERVATGSGIGLSDVTCLPNTLLYGSHPTSIQKKNAEQFLRSLTDIIQKGE